MPLFVRHLPGAGESAFRAQQLHTPGQRFHANSQVGGPLIPDPYSSRVFSAVCSNQNPPKKRLEEHRYLIF